MIEDYKEHLSSFEFIPKTFLDIDTSLFGSSNNNPFLILKEKAKDETVKMEDRMQCIRYMCRIPFKDHINHSIDASKTIVLTQNYDPYKLFYFYANNDKYVKLDDHVVYHTHPTFFSRCIGTCLPFELTILVCKAIYITYPFESDERTEVLEYILDIADNPNESVKTRAECADLLFTFGEGDEIFFGKKIINQLGELYDKNKIKTIWTNSQNVHNEIIQESILNIVTTLHRKSIQSSNEDKDLSIEQVQEMLLQLYSDAEMIVKEKIVSFCYRIIVDPSRYQNLTLFDVFLLIWNFIQNSIHKDQLLIRLLEEILDMDETCSTGYLTRLVNVITGYVEEEELVLRLSPKDELRSATFARIMAKIRSLPDQIRNDILEELGSESKEKQMFDEFMEINSPFDELLEEYKTLLPSEEFTEIFNNCIVEFKLFAV